MATTFTINISEESIAKDSQTLPQESFYVKYFSNMDKTDEKNKLLSEWLKKLET